MTAIRLTVLLTHPIQYYGQWFRHIAAHAPDLELTVVHAVQPTPDQQGIGFGRAFNWDTAPADGYRSVTVSTGEETRGRVDSTHFFGLDVRDVGHAVLSTSPDVVLIPGWYSITQVRALAACRRRGIPVLYRGDSHLGSAPSDWRYAAWTMKTRVLLRQFNGFLSPGRRGDEYLRRFRVPGHRIFRVPNGVDNAFFEASAAPFTDPCRRAEARRSWHIDPDAFVPLFVGRLAPSKRPLDLIRAAARLGRRVTVLVVGAGQLEGDIRAEAARLSLDVRLAGFLNQSELGQAYGAADCLVLPSDSSETWGLVVNEAMATGLPAIVSDAVGCGPDLVVDGRTGFVFPLGEINALGERLAALRDRIAGGEDWAPACREQVAPYGFETMTAGLARACRSVLQHSVGAEPRWPEHSTRIIACCGQMVIAGGLERMTFEVLRAARQKGMAVHCVVNAWDSTMITRLADDIGASWSVGPYWRSLTRRLDPLAIAKMTLEVIQVSRDLLRLARRVRPTHVLLPDFQAVLRNAPALFWLRARGVRIVARLGNAPTPGPFYQWLWRHAIDPFVDEFVANSTFTRDELLRFGIAAGKVQTITNIPATRQPVVSPSGARLPGRVVYVGQIIPEKGLDLLLDAIALVRARGLNVTLDVVGDLDGWEPPALNGYRPSVRARAARPDLAGQVQFLGWREDVPAVMSRASVHCCPSRPEIREGFGVVVLEAKLAGLPSIVAPSGNLPNLVTHREDGWACADATPQSIADGIEFFVADPARLARAAEAARRSAAQFDAGRFSAAWCRVFESRGDRCA